MKLRVRDNSIVVTRQDGGQLCGCCVTIIFGLNSESSGGTIFALATIVVRSLFSFNNNNNNNNNRDTKNRSARETGVVEDRYARVGGKGEWQLN
mgnify:CR=1 FL=1